MPPPDSILSTTDLISHRAITLQKRSEDLARIYSDVYKARREAVLRFIKEHEATMRDYNFKRGNLVLMRNSKVEMSLNTKMKPRYLGPLVVVASHCLLKPWISIWNDCDRWKTRMILMNRTAIRFKS
jgi:hypothetical protein